MYSPGHDICLVFHSKNNVYHWCKILQLPLHYACINYAAKTTSSQISINIQNNLFQGNAYENIISNYQVCTFMFNYSGVSAVICWQHLNFGIMVSQAWLWLHRYDCVMYSLLWNTFSFIYLHQSKWPRYITRTLSILWIKLPPYSVNMMYEYIDWLFKDMIIFHINTITDLLFTSFPRIQYKPGK